MNDATDAAPAAAVPGANAGSITLGSLLQSQNRYWREGRQVLVEEYLRNAPSLRSDSEKLLDLVYNEIRLREELGETPELDEYRRRFPEVATELAVQFEVHRALRPGSQSDDAFLDAYARAATSSPLPTVEGYEILGELGRGAMGVVYKARHVRLNRAVALKMILAGAYAGSRDRARFETEAQAIARLQHPHIVQIHEIGEQVGRPFVCLELVQGGSLAQKLAGRPLPPRQAAELVEMVARAVHYAHEQQVLHRDLKPANVLLAPSDSRRGIRFGDSEGASYHEPKITDFGLAKLLDGEPDSPDGTATHESRTPVGTPPYMAPEQVTITGATQRGSLTGGGRAIDVYALGAILYETLTGRPPFLAATVYETLQQVCALEPVPPRRLQPQVPRDLETICLACLRKDPHRRYATALDVADDLRRFLDGRPIRQRPPAAWEPAWKWARRRPAAATLVVLGALALIAAVVGSSYYLRHREQWARRDAAEHFQRFTRRRDDALFRGTLFAASQLAPPDRAASDVKTAREAAREALSIAGVIDDGQPAFPESAYLTSDERLELSASCYDMLLMLSQAATQLPPDTTPDEQRRQATEALTTLERAGRLRPPTPAYHLRRAHLLTMLGDQAGALAEQERARTVRSESASDYYFAGVDQYQRGEIAEAARSFRDALRLQPNHFEAQCFLAICSLNAGRPGEARVGLTACIGRRPDFAWTYLLRGFAAVQEADDADAEADFAAAFRLDDSNPVRYAAHVNRGLLRMRQGKLEEAISDLQEAVTLRPDEFQAYVTLARAFQRQVRAANAAQAIDTAVRLRPDLAIVYRARGQLRKEWNDLAGSLADFETAARRESNVGRSPAAADDHVECGRIHHLQGRFSDAVAAYDRALAVNPEHAIAYHLRGEALLELNRAAEAERSFGESLKRRPAFGPALRARGQARVRLGNFAGAVEDYTEALSLERDASVLTHRGWAYCFTDAWKLAEHDFDEAIHLDRRPGDAQVGRGLARVMLGDHRRAVADADEVIRAGKPDRPEMVHNVACVYALAADKMRGDATEPDREAVAAGYRRQAVAELRKAVGLLPPEQRLAYWQTRMRPDAALDSIRHSPEFIQLDGELQRERLPTQKP
jgi:serine/threonine protein kinase/predicted Zn-dependent protease